LEEEVLQQAQVQKVLMVQILEFIIHQLLFGQLAAVAQVQAQEPD
jgi:hypothetical protein